MKTEKNRIVAIILALCFGNLGLHRFYMGKLDGILYLLFSWTSIPHIISICQGIMFMCIKDEQFKALCSDRSLTDNFNDVSDAIKKLLEEGRVDSSNSTIYQKNSDERREKKVSFDSKPIDKNDEYYTHEHIKPDKELAKKTAKAQDRLERYTNNDYFPAVNKAKQSKENKIKELKELKSQGLISNETYKEEMRKL